MSFDLNQVHKVAIDIARQAGRHTLKYFRQSFEVELKDDESPVTTADRETEKIMREEIQKRFPDHGILGEEFGKTNSESNVQWILDPIDGTRSFIHGIPFYTSLIGVNVNHEPQIGVVYAPALDELYEAAVEKGARLNGQVCSVRECDDLSKATFLSTDVTTPADFDYEQPFRELLARTPFHRTWGDAYGHMMVAAGRADLMFDPVLNIWDAAPIITILKEAGGIFSDTAGRQTIQTGNGFSCSKTLYPSVLEIFRKHAQE